MAVAKKTTETVTNTFEMFGEEVEVLTGLNIVDKATLVDKPFIITGVRVMETKPNDDGEIFEYVQVEAKISKTEKVTFQDSSTGVKAALITLLKDRFNWNGEMNEWYDFKFGCPQGLRVSPFKKNVKGHMVDSQTYHLTFSGEGRQEKVKTDVPA